MEVKLLKIAMIITKIGISLKMLQNRSLQLAWYVAQFLAIVQGVLGVLGS